MKLVKIEDKWINPEFVCAVYGIESFTKVQLVNSDEPFSFNIPIEKVLQAIEGSKEHLDETRKYLLHDENTDATLLVCNSTATVSVIDSDEVKTLFFKRD